MVMNRALSVAGATVLAATLSGCVAYAGGEFGPAPVYHSVYEEDVIPAGHMPPPGECRIWYPDRPPGQQPPPGDCRSLRHQVPPGAIFVQG